MTSILEVEQLDTLSSNASSTLTIGGTNTTTIAFKSGATFSNITQGITMANQWRLTTSFAVSGTTDITSNIESIDSDSAGSIGSLMTQSSGVFTFPSTGIYLVMFNMYINYNGTSPIYYCENYIQVSTDGGSSFGIAAANASSLNGDVRNGSAITLHLLDVTDTSLIKVKFQVASSSTPQVVGDTSASHTSFTFIRLGDT